MARGRRGRTIALTAGTLVLVLVGVATFLYRREIAAWYHLVTRFERLADNEQGYSEYRHRQTEIVFVRLPGGTLNMSSPDGEKWRHPTRELRHEVPVSPFLIAKNEVNQTEWKKTMGHNPSKSGGESAPVNFVSWNRCQEFCEMTNLSLPTTTQWEYATRNAVSGPNSFGLLGVKDGSMNWCRFGDQSRSDESPTDWIHGRACRSADAEHQPMQGTFGEENYFCRFSNLWGLNQSVRGSNIFFRPVYNFR